MQDTLITYETAKLAKEKGFNLETLHYYYKNELVEPYLENGSSTDVEFRVDLEDLYDYHNKPYLKERCSAPTQSLLQKWLREEHNIHVSAFPVFSNKYFPTVRKFFEDKEYKTILGAPYEPGYSEKTYEEALEKGLQEGLKLIKI